MKPKPLVIANWKMHKTHLEGKQFIEALAPHLKPSVDVWITPSFTALSTAVEAAAGSSLKIGAQNMHEAPQGAFTGEISAEQLKALGVSYVLLGHSERRHIFHETSARICAKVKAALSVGLTPVLCIGETLEQRESGKTDAVLKQQIDESLKGFSAQDLHALVLAYEPVWAIGTGKVATPELAEEAHIVAKNHMQQLFGKPFADNLRILYGGSVKGEYMELLLLKEPYIHGVLVGGASLEVSTFAHIIQEAAL